jgi:hypothetical protein
LGWYVFGVSRSFRGKRMIEVVMLLENGATYRGGLPLVVVKAARPVVSSVSRADEDFAREGGNA